MRDNFPRGDPLGFVPEKLLESMMQADSDSTNLKSGGSGQCFDAKVTFIKLNPSTDQMIQVFNEHLAAAIGKQISISDLSQVSSAGGLGQDITAEFGRAVEEEIMQTWMAHHH